MEEWLAERERPFCLKKEKGITEPRGREEAIHE
jgi:hypothetical protein